MFYSLCLGIQQGESARCSVFVCMAHSSILRTQISGQLLAFSPQIIIGCVPLAYEYFESSSSAMDNILYIPRTDQAESTEPK